MKTFIKATVKLLTVGILVTGAGMLAGCSDPTKIEGDTAKVNHTVQHTDNVYNAARGVAESVYSTAKGYPNIKKIEVTVELEAEGVKDSYGNEVKGPLIMGTIESSDLAEIRKYSDAFSYQSKNQEWYEFQVKQLKYASALAKY